MVYTDLPAQGVREAGNLSQIVLSIFSEATPNF
jgi:hypothetical protein